MNSYWGHNQHKVSNMASNLLRVLIIWTKVDFFRSLHPFPAFLSSIISLPLTAHVLRTCYVSSHSNVRTLPFCRSCSFCRHPPPPYLHLPPGDSGLYTRAGSGAACRALLQDLQKHSRCLHFQIPSRFICLWLEVWRSLFLSFCLGVGSLEPRSWGALTCGLLKNLFS